MSLALLYYRGYKPLKGVFQKMLVAKYKTKKELKESVGKELRFEETSMHGPEYKPDGSFGVVGPGAYERKWYAQVTMKDGLIQKVT